MLTIRLQRAGKKNQAEFRIVLAEKTAAVSKKAQEILGNYNARRKEFKVKNGERLNYWLSQQVEISPTVHNLLVSQNLLTGTKVKSFNIPKKPAAPAEAVSPAATPAVEIPAAEAQEVVSTP